MDKFNQLVSDPIFIIGAARSGTTWVHDILAAHPQVASVYESWLFTSQNGLGALFTSAHWPPGYSGLGRLLSREELLSYTRGIAQQIMSHAIQPEHRFLIEKSPSHAFAIDLIVELFPGARFIHVLRDGRDVCVSVRAAAESWAPEWKNDFGKSIRAAAMSWRDVVKVIQNKARNLDNEFLEMRYEALQRDRIGSYRRLFDFCNIPCDDQMLQQIEEATDFEKKYANKKTAGFRRKGQVGDWQHQLSLKERWDFNREAGRLLLELGYEPNSWWWLNPGKQQLQVESGAGQLHEQGFTGQS